MQDNYDWCGPSAVRTRDGIANDRWQTVQGGDGFVAIIDLRDGRIVYSESQDGNIDAAQPRDRRVEEHSSDAGNTTDSAGRRRVPLPLGHADALLADDPGVLLVAGNKRVPVDRSRRLVDGGESRI